MNFAHFSKQATLLALEEIKQEDPNEKAALPN